MGMYVGETVGGLEMVVDNCGMLVVRNWGKRRKKWR